MTDYIDEDGKEIVITPDMLRTSDGVTKFGCLVNNKFKKKFDAEIEWQKVSKKTGEAINEEDATQGNENVESNQPSSIDTSTGTTDTSTGSNNNGGDDIPAGNG